MLTGLKNLQKVINLYLALSKGKRITPTVGVFLLGFFALTGTASAASGSSCTNTTYTAANGDMSEKPTRSGSGYVQNIGPLTVTSTGTVAVSSETSRGGAELYANRTPIAYAWPNHGTIDMTFNQPITSKWAVTDIDQSREESIITVYDENGVIIPNPANYIVTTAQGTTGTYPNGTPTTFTDLGTNITVTGSQNSVSLSRFSGRSTTTFVRANMVFFDFGDIAVSRIVVDDIGSGAPGFLFDSVKEACPTEIELTKTLKSGGPEAEAGETLTYEIILTNLGDIDGTISVDETVPMGTTNLSGDSFNSCALGVSAGTTCTNTSPNVPAGGTATMTFSVKVDDPINVNSIENVVIKTGDIPPTCTAAVNSDPRCVSIPVPFLDQPNLSMTKASTGGDPFDEIGDIVTYEYVVTNTGNVAVANITVSDDKIPTVNCPSPASNSLAVGASITCTGSYTIIAADVSAGQVVNVANPSATPPPNTSIPPMEFPPIVTVPLESKPNLSMTKASTGGDPFDEIGDIVTYEYVVTNTGNVAVANITVSDDKIPTVNCPSPASNSLAVGASITCTGSYTIIAADVSAGQVVNVANPSATPPPNTSIPPMEFPPIVTVPLDPKPNLSMTKASTGGDPFDEIGDIVTYEYVVTNTGNVAVANITVSDDKIPTVNCPSPASNSLAVGASITCTGSYTIIAADVSAGQVVNVANPSATPPPNTSIPPMEFPPIVTVPLDPKPKISVVKTATAPTVNLGINTSITDLDDTITYTLVTKNTGNVILNSVTISDTLVDMSTAVCAATSNGDVWANDNSDTLDIGESVSCSVDYVLIQTDIDAGKRENTVTVQGTPPTGPPIEGQSTVITPLQQKTSIELLKSATVIQDDDGSSSVTVGDTVDYTFTVKNTGNVTLTNVDVTDETAGLGLTIACPSGANPILSLTAGATEICTATYTLNAADVAGTGNAVINAGTGEFEIANDAKVVGIPPVNSGLTPPTSTSSALATAQVSAAISLEKSAGAITDADVDGKDSVGDTVTYSYLVKNTGTSILTGVTVTEDAANFSGTGTDPIPSGGLTTLNPGDSTTFTATYTLTQMDIDSGKLNNTAEATGTPPPGLEDPKSKSSVVVPITASPDFLVVKDSNSVPVKVGDTLDYTFTVANTGNVSLLTVTLVDAKCATQIALDSESITPDTILEVDEVQVYSCTSVPTTQAEVDAGKVDNTVTGTVTPPPGVPPVPPKDGDKTVPMVRTPDFTVIKDSNSVPVNVGDTLDYTFTVTNTGNVSLLTVTLVDAKCATPIALDSETKTADTILEVNEVQVYSCTSVPTTQAEVDAGKVDNTVTGTVTPPPGVPPVPPKDGDKTVPVVRTPDFTVVKDTNSLPIKVGDTLDYTFTVVNTGNVSLSSVTVVDVKCAATPILTSGDTNLDGRLNIDETFIYSCTSIPVTQSEVDAGKVDNTVRVTVVPPTGVPPVDPKDADKSVPLTPTPLISTTKGSSLNKGSDGVISVGDLVTYTYVVENTGNVTLTSVTITETQADFTGTGVLPVPGWQSNSGASAQGTLVVGEKATFSATYALTAADIAAGKLDNRVVGKGTPPNQPNGDPSTPVTDKSDSSNQNDPNETNIPNDPNGDDKTGTLLSSASISIIKSMTGIVDTVADGITGAGDSISYSFLVTNTGNLDLNPISVTDAKVANIICQSTSLAIGDSTSCIGDRYTITQQDVTDGGVENTAIATGTPKNADGSDGIPVTDKSDAGTNPDGSPVDTPTTEETPSPVGKIPNDPNDPTDDPTTVLLTPSPKIALVKQGKVNGTGIAGETISYTFTVTNVGNVPLTNVTITDDLPGMVVTGSISSLAVGQVDSTSIKGAYVIQSTDVTVGSVTNQATVSGKGPKGTTVTDKSDNTSVFEDDPTVTLLNPPVVVDDKRTYIPGQSKTLNILDNDGQAIPIVASSLRFTTTGTPNATLSGDGKTLTVPGEGEWVMGENGEVTFTPEQGYLGSNPTPPTYTGVSADGQVSNEARIILQGALPPSNEPIPTLSEWALMMLILLLGFVGYRQASLKRGVRF